VNVDDHVVQLGRHGTALADAASRAGLDRPVPTCPDWTVRDLLGHLGGVHRWAATIVRDRRNDPGDELVDPPSDGELLGWYIAGHAALIDVLTGADPGIECWTFLPAPTPLAFWARRQAHETAIHRCDADRAAGRVSEFDPEFAVDGIDELLSGFVARPRGRLVADPPVTLGIDATDGGADAAWTLTVGPDSRQVERGSAQGDCVLAGPAADLYPLLWNRRDLHSIVVSGDPAVLHLWRDKARIRFS
jgi:uncharacterized protein (TIGR03083 family)